MISLRIPFAPKAKSSVRLGKKGAYNPSAKGMASLQEAIKSKLLGIPLPLFKKSVKIVICFHFPAPLSLPKKRREALHGTFYEKRPDGDNLEKFFSDSANGVLWKDDKSIVSAHWAKCYTKERRGFIDIDIVEIKKGELVKLPFMTTFF